MKRRNREDRARQRTIQEYHLTKPYQRAMDLVHREYGLSYRTILRCYQIGARPGSLQVDFSTFRISGFEVLEDGTAEVKLTDTGRIVHPYGLYWRPTAE